MSRATSLVAREHELDRALYSLRFSGGVLIAGEAGVGKTLLAASVAEQLAGPARRLDRGDRGEPVHPAGRADPAAAARSGHHPPGAGRPARQHPAARAEPRPAVDRGAGARGGRPAAARSPVGRGAVVAGRREVGTPARHHADRREPLRRRDRAVEGAARRPDGPRAARPRRVARAAGRRCSAGPVATGTTEMLWQSSHGNPFYLTELARFGADHGLLECQAGVWWWTGEEEMPPRLGELLQRRLDALTDDGREAVAVLALGEPLPYETLAAVVGEDAIMELDRNQIITSDERDGVVLLRFSHPLLHAVAERQLSPARRRILARRLRDAPAEHVDIVRRATWEDAGGGEPNVELLLAAADAVLLNDPAAALRLANRAHQAGTCVKAAVMVASAQSELGRPDRARVTLEEARPAGAHRGRPVPARRRGAEPGVVGRARPRTGLGDGRPAAHRAGVQPGELRAGRRGGGPAVHRGLCRRDRGGQSDPGQRPRPAPADLGPDLPDRGAGLRRPRRAGDRRRAAAAGRPGRDPGVGDPGRAGVRAGRGHRAVLRRGVPAAPAGGPHRAVAGGAGAAGSAAGAGGGPGHRPGRGSGRRPRLAAAGRAEAALPRRPGRGGRTAARGVRAAAGGGGVVPVRGDGRAGGGAGRAR